MTVSLSDQEDVQIDKLDAIAIGLSCLSDEQDSNRFRARARASLVERALELAGFVIVPKEATEAMLNAYLDLCNFGGELGVNTPADAYRAMIAASRETPATPAFERSDGIDGVDGICCPGAVGHPGPEGRS